MSGTFLPQTATTRSITGSILTRGTGLAVRRIRRMMSKPRMIRIHPSKVPTTHTRTKIPAK